MGEVLIILWIAHVATRPGIQNLLHDVHVYQGPCQTVFITFGFDSYLDTPVPGFRIA